MPIQKIKSGRVNIPDIETYIGDNGIIFFDELQGELRLGDGITPGGIPLTVGGGGGGGNYILPTASTTVKGGVKIDGSTITIANQVISVGTVPYSKISDTPTIPTNTNQLTNGAGFITSGALSGYATETYVTTRGYLTSVSWNDVQSKPSFSAVATSGSYNDLTNKPTIPTNNNQLTNGAGYITSSALSGYATETYVTTRGYLTSVSWNDILSKPSFAAVATSGSYTDLTNKPTLFSGSYNDLTDRPSLFSGSYTDLTNKPTIPTDISQLTDTQGLLGQGGGGGGGTTVITNNIENPYTFSVAGDDSTLREISNGETLRFAGATGITITSDAEGKITIAGPDLSGYATQSYVTSQGYLTTVDYSIITNKPTLFSGSYTDLTDKPTLFSGSYDDLTNKPTIPTNTNELTNGAGFITSSALTGYATESFVTTQGFLTTVSWNDLTDKPNLAGTFNFYVASDDSTQRQINSDNLIKFIGGTGISTSSDSDGNITINGFSGSYNDLTDKPTSSALNANGTLSMPLLSSEPADLQAGQIALANGTNWDPLIKSEGKPYLTLYTGSGWIDIGGLTSSDVYKQILEMG
jgi:hypothetical protein